MPLTVLRTAIPYPLIWGKEDWLQVRLDARDYKIAFERSWRRGANNMDLRYDRLGRVSYTKIALLFPDFTDTDNTKELKEIAHKAVNRLLDVYRVRTKEFHVGSIPLHELGAIGALDSIVTTESGGQFRDTFSFDFGLAPCRPPEKITDQAVQDLALERPLPVVDVLVLNARRSLLLENYRLAVIEAETAFEVGVDSVLSSYYSAKSLPRVKVDKLLDCGLANLLEHHMRKALGRNFTGTAEHDRWYEDLYKVRNAVVHDGKSVQSNEAQRALEAAEDALASIGAIYPQEWPAGDRLNQGTR